MKTHMLYTAVIASLALVGCSGEANSSSSSKDASLSGDADYTTDAGGDGAAGDDAADRHSEDASDTSVEDTRAPQDTTSSPRDTASPGDTADARDTHIADGGSDAKTDAGGSESLIFGVYRGGATGDDPNEQIQRIDDYEAWIGRPVRVRITFIWEESTDWGPFESPWQISRWKAWDQGRANRQWAIAVPNFPKGDQYSLAECATGAYNSHFKKLAQSLVDNSLEDAILRIGPEFNGGWVPYSAVNKEAEFAGCWREIVDTMRSVSGQAFVMNWNPNRDDPFDIQAAWPGDSYVDEVGVDTYDLSWPYYTEANCGPSRCPIQNQRDAWNNIHNGTTPTNGLDDWAAFARQHNKPLAVPEWGVWESREDDGSWLYGGGDDPYYVERMHTWMHDPANNVRWASYFDAHALDGDHKLYGSTQFPDAKAKYKMLFGR